MLPAAKKRQTAESAVNEPVKPAAKRAAPLGKPRDSRLV